LKGLRGKIEKRDFEKRGSNQGLYPIERGGAGGVLEVWVGGADSGLCGARYGVRGEQELRKRFDKWKKML
jgi:hypothetical protein